MIYLRLYWNFFTTGLFSVGGGLATLPFLYDMAEKTGWFTAVQLADMLAVSESTPGAIGVNMATYIGYITAGLPGDIIATLGLVSPSVILILIIARILKRFRENKYVDWAFYGLRAASAGLIAASGVSVARITFLRVGLTSGASLLQAINVREIILAVFLYFAIKKLNKIHPVIFIAFSALIGIIFTFAGV